jgi:protein gp37
VGLKNVFTVSMGDLFGDWVPASWINAVLTAISDNPKWNFLLLTKFPERLTEFGLPINAWVGVTVDRQAGVRDAEMALRAVEATVKFVSCEPLLERLTFADLSVFDWVIIGGATRSTQSAEFHPPLRWVNYLEKQARDAGCRIYEKANLFGEGVRRCKQYPNHPVSPSRS